MTERQLADLLRHIDEDVESDVDEIEFKIRLRSDLDETLGRDRVTWARLSTVDRSPRRTPRAGLMVAAAAVVVIVAGALLLAERPTSDAPASQIVISSPTSTTTVPVLDAGAACERFRTSNANEILAAMIPDDLTIAELNDAVDAMDVLLADVDATHPDDLFRPLLFQVRNATREAALLLGVDDRAGARTALEAARIESGTRLERTRYASCFDR